MAHYGLSHEDLRCLMSSLSTLHINLFPVDSSLKKADDKCSLLAPKELMIVILSLAKVFQDC